jgi:anti-sigma factor RsiW
MPCASVRISLAEAGREARAPMLLRVFTLAATFAAVALVSWNLGVFQGRPGDEELVARDVVTAHVRSLMGETHLNDVISSDQHTVKPWFTGKLDFAPPVQDLTEKGYSLAGGRLDYVNGRAVAALTYRLRQHVVNVFIWPAAGQRDSAPAGTSRQGYSLLHWVRGGMSYWAVSDAAPGQLTGLAEEPR